MLVVALSATHMTGYQSSLCGKQVWIQNTGAFDAALADVGQWNTVIATIGDTCPDGDAASGGCQLDDIGRLFSPKIFHECCLLHLLTLVIDLSPAAASQLTNGAYETLGRVNVKWGMVGDPAVPQ